MLNKVQKTTLFIRILGFKKIPLIFYCRPYVTHISEESLSVKIKLKRRTQNHLKSMYFGVLAVGADLAGGILAMQHINKIDKKVVLVFKDFKAEFHKRADGDVVFTCADGKEIKALVKQASETGERQNLPLKLIATVPNKYGDEPVASFILTLSLRKKY